MRNTKLNRWRFQYSLRSLLLFMLFVNVGMACLCSLWRAAKQQTEAAAAIRAVGADVLYDYEVEHAAEWGASSTAKWSAPVPPGPAWARRLLGKDFFANVVDVGFRGWIFDRRAENPITDRCLGHIGKLPRLEVLDLGWSRVSDAGLKSLQRLARLRELNLAETSVTDTGVERLEGLAQLRELNLAGTRITDRGLRSLGKLTHLEVLDLSRTKVTEAGMGQLRQLGELRLLGFDADGALGGCEQRLHRAFPRCEICFRGGLFLGGRLVHSPVVPIGGISVGVGKMRARALQLPWDATKRDADGDGSDWVPKAGRSGY
jgi:hypothetical protein